MATISDRIAWVLVPSFLSVVYASAPGLAQNFLAETTHSRNFRAYAAEWAAFVAAITDSTPIPVTLDDGVAALAMAEAATRSAKTGAPVSLADL